MLRRFGGLALVTLLALAGCTSGPPPVAHRGKQYSNIVSLSPSTSEIASVLDGGMGLKGRTSECNYPPAIKAAKIVVDGTTPNYEAITVLKPDLIIYDETLYGKEVVDKINALGFQTLAFNVKTVDDYVKFIKELALIRGGETTASDNMDSLRAEISSDRGLVQASGQHPKIALIDPGTTILAAGTKSFDFDLFKQCGVQVVGPDSDKWADWNVEDLIKADPDSIVTVEGGVEKIKADPRLAGLSAVKKNKMFEIKSDVLLRIGSRVDLLIRSVVSRTLNSAAPATESATAEKPVGDAATEGNSANKEKKDGAQHG